MIGKCEDLVLSEVETFHSSCLFAEKNISHHISSFNESTGFGLLKASPVEFVRYPLIGNLKKRSNNRTLGALFIKSNI